MVDHNDCRYSAEQLRQWKVLAEKQAERRQLGGNIEPPVVLPQPQLKEKWIHETTDDDRYVPRNELLDRLDRWTASHDVRVITVTGIGGQGKTAFVGHWLKRKRALKERGIQGFFYWSFYNETDVNIFFHGLITFCRQDFVLPFTLTDDIDDPLMTLRKLLSHLSLCVVLDGLEVIQVEQSEREKGQFVSAELRYFLADLCLQTSRSMAVLTSRFDIVDLRPYRNAVKSLRLGKLCDDEACAILANLFVGGSRVDRSRINAALEGHPLALKVFAAGLPKENQGNPISHLNRILSIQPQPKHALSEKINRLLRCYEESLSEYQIAMLCGVSLLKKSIDETSLIALCEKQVKQTASLQKNASQLIGVLSSLVTSGLVIRDMINGTKRYSCHPIVRDYFRSRITSDVDRGNLVGEYLASRPGRYEVTDNETLEYVVSAIEVLSASGSWHEASELYDVKLGRGIVFKRLANPEAGWRCVQALTQSAPKHPVVYASIFNNNDKFNTLVVYLNAAGQFSQAMGDLDNAMTCYHEALEILAQHRQVRNQSLILLGLTEACIEAGELTNAYSYLADAMNYANERDIVEEFLLRLHLARGMLHLLHGEHQQAAKRFIDVVKKTQLNSRARAKKSQQPDLRALGFYGLVEVAIDTGQLGEAEGLVKSAIPYAQQADRQDLLLIGLYLQGRVLAEMGNDTLAEMRLNSAESLARKANMEYWLTKITILQSELLFRKAEKEKAMLLIDDCINVARSRKFGTVIVDALLAKVSMMNENMSEEIDELLYEAEQCAEQAGYTRALRQIV
ncbi:hypothetical protein KY46_04860 [Photobacterium halotolerans]|uniref:Uncharacterized protein n=1 Tax=Photobacterium halotolerans TaxID=265726 RepID=A0A0F5VH23_9GAMM|nr:hypothetical protein KY46_04860 [Photobacterium halotolerans]